MHGERPLDPAKLASSISHRQCKSYSMPFELHSIAMSQSIDADGYGKNRHSNVNEEQISELGHLRDNQTAYRRKLIQQKNHAQQFTKILPTYSKIVSEKIIERNYATEKNELVNENANSSREIFLLPTTSAVPTSDRKYGS